MNNGNVDSRAEFGIRITPPNLVYSFNDASRWIGSGILNKPIGVFDLTYSVQGFWNSVGDAPYFAENRSGSVRIQIHRSLIPESEEYALGFVFFHLHFQRNRQQRNDS